MNEDLRDGHDVNDQLRDKYDRIAASYTSRYADPDGTPRFCHNTEVASSRFVLFERRGAGWEEAAVLTSEGTTHAEWAGRTPAPGEFAQHLAVGEGAE